ncbi:MAG: hypothetical protein DWQ08_03810 [Proteobacteria bacterium]|nr:MAG: hypothetical protein DWQ08_03810 [Pseudomonadota bacterium]
MDADAFGRALEGAGFNLLVPEIERAMRFQSKVLGARVAYADPDFAVVEGAGGRWLFHADHTYRDHPVYGIVTQLEGRGAGVELRLYHTDPDDAERRARALGYTVLAGSADKPHGLRECYLLDDDGYLWVPSIPLPE